MNLHPFRKPAARSQLAQPATTACTSRRDKPPSGFPHRPGAATLRITPLDVQVAWSHNEPDAMPTIRELDIEILRAWQAGDKVRRLLLMEHRLVMLQRAQAAAFAPNESELPL
jgi:hypothetical protein